jgi:triphosphoribosyl-dephospho-CoA synthetase
VLAPGQVSPESIVKSVKEFVEAPAEERDRRARDLGRQLRPLAADAEKFVAKALNLGARGLNGLAARLEQRRRERDGTGSGDPSGPSRG